MLVMQLICGYQVENECAENFEHESFEIITSETRAQHWLQNARQQAPEHQWSLMPVTLNTVQDPSFI